MSVFLSRPFTLAAVLVRRSNWEGATSRSASSVREPTLQTHRRTFNDGDSLNSLQTNPIFPNRHARAVGCRHITSSIAKPQTFCNNGPSHVYPQLCKGYFYLAMSDYRIFAVSFRATGINVRLPYRLTEPPFPNLSF